MHVRPARPEDAAWIEARVADAFASPRVVSRGVLHDTAALPCLLAVDADSRPLGLAHYRIESAALEVVTLIAVERRRGAGRALLAALLEQAQDHGCTRAWLVTTNDNAGAMAFYERLGWSCVTVHEGAVEASRRLKPELPTHDARGVPIRDEHEYEWRLEPAAARRAAR